MLTARRIPHDGLMEFAAATYRDCGMREADARLAADSLVQADLWGHQSHGLMRLPWYEARLRAGVVNPVAEPEIAVDAGALAVMDGQHAMGQIVATRAMREAIRRAKAHGVGVVAVRNSNHFGTAMYYTLMAPPEGCVAFLSTNTSPAMAPWGGRAKTVGNNPWSITAPAGRHPPMMLDIANTRVARGKIYLARQKGLPIPLGWAVDARGVPTTDPVEALAGIIQPMAEHKGYAISVMMDVLSGVLTGSGFGARVSGPYQSERRGLAGHLVIVLNIETIQPLAEFNARMETLVSELKAVPLAPDFEEVVYPGELEARNNLRNREEGLELPPDTLEGLRQVAKRAKLESLLPF